MEHGSPEEVINNNTIDYVIEINTEIKSMIKKKVSQY